MDAQLETIDEDVGFTIKTQGKMNDWDGWDSYNRDMSFYYAISDWTMIDWGAFQSIDMLDRSICDGNGKNSAFQQILQLSISLFCVI